MGFYIRKGLNFKVLQNCSNFINKTFECLTIELSYPKKQILISNVYHSPNPPSNCTITDHSSNFLEYFDTLMSDLANLNKDVYIFLDANIDLLKLNQNPLCNSYLDIGLSNGFVQLVARATRIQGEHFSLIDHIFSNANQKTYNVGTLVLDISDHFANLIELPFQKPKSKEKCALKNSMTDANINTFKNALGALQWVGVCSEPDVNKAFIDNYLHHSE